MIRLQFIGGLRDSDANLKSLEALRANDNLTVEKLLQRIQYRTQAKRFAESSLHQSTSSVVAYAKKRGPNYKKDLSCHQKPERCGRYGRKPFHPVYECPKKVEKCHICSKQEHYSRMCNLERQEASGKHIETQLHQCTILVKNNNSKNPPHLKKPYIMQNKWQL